MLVTSHVINIESQAPTSNISHQHHILAYYDVGDRCKSLRICLKTEKNLLNLAPGWFPLLLHNISVTNITFWSIMSNHFLKIEILLRMTLFKRVLKKNGLEFPAVKTRRSCKICKLILFQCFLFVKYSHEVILQADIHICSSLILFYGHKYAQEKYLPPRL